MDESNTVDISSVALVFDGKSSAFKKTTVRVAYGVNKLMSGNAEIGRIYRYFKTNLELQAVSFPFFDQYLKPKTIINRIEVCNE